MYVRSLLKATLDLSRQKLVILPRGNIFSANFGSLSFTRSFFTPVWLLKILRSLTCVLYIVKNKMIIRLFLDQT